MPGATPAAISQLKQNNNSTKTGWVSEEMQYSYFLLLILIHYSM